jgi:hypothetical protein
MESSRHVSQPTHNKRMQPDFGKLRLPQPLMRGVMRQSKTIETEA